MLGGLGSLAGRGLGRGAAGAAADWSSDLAPQPLASRTNVSANLPLAVYGVVLIVRRCWPLPAGIQGVVTAARAWRVERWRPSGP